MEGDYRFTITFFCPILEFQHIKNILLPFLILSAIKVMLILEMKIANIYIKFIHPFALNSNVLSKYNFELSGDDFRSLGILLSKLFWAIFWNIFTIW